MTDETKTCRICGTKRSCGEYPGAHPPDLCKPCAFDRIDFAKAIVTGFCANHHVTSMKEQTTISDETFMVVVFDMAEEMLLESRKPKAKS